VARRPARSSRSGTAFPSPVSSVSSSACPRFATFCEAHPATALANRTVATTYRLEMPIANPHVEPNPCVSVHAHAAGPDRVTARGQQRPMRICAPRERDTSRQGPGRESGTDVPSNAMRSCHSPCKANAMTIRSVKLRALRTTWSVSADHIVPSVRYQTGERTSTRSVQIRVARTTARRSIPIRDRSSLRRPPILWRPQTTAARSVRTRFPVGKAPPKVTASDGRSLKAPMGTSSTRTAPPRRPCFPGNLVLIVGPAIVDQHRYPDLRLHSLVKTHNHPKLRRA